MMDSAIFIIRDVPVNVKKKPAKNPPLYQKQQGNPDLHL